MKWEEELDEVLGKAGREHRMAKAPGYLESALLAQMSVHAASSSQNERGKTLWLRPMWVYGLAAAVVALSIWGAVAWRHPAHRESGGNAAIPGVPQKPAQPTPVPLTAEIASRESVHHESSRIAKPRPHTAEPQVASVDSMDAFIPLPVSEGLPPATSISLVRMRMLGSDLQQYGLEATPDAAAKSLLAEFLVGEDGLPRAIRIVP